MQTLTIKRRRKNKEVATLALEVKETKAIEQQVTAGRLMVKVPTLQFRESLLEAAPSI